MPPWSETCSSCHRPSCSESYALNYTTIERGKTSTFLKSAVYKFFVELAFEWGKYSVQQNICMGKTFD